MPSCMRPEAGARSAARPATAATTAAKKRMRLRNDRMFAKRAEHPAQTLLERDLGLPAQDLLRARDVGLPDLRVVDRQRLEDDLARRGGHAEDGLRQLKDGELAGVAQV